jgi:CDI immunity proteins
MPDSQVQDNDRSLEQIEDDVWGDPPTGATKLMETVHRLRRRPLATLEAEDLRVLVAQQVGLDVLVPRTLAKLEEDPLLEGDYYPGDVLAAVLRVPASYWSANPAQRTTLENIIAAIDTPDSYLKADIDAFHAANPA